VASRAWCRQAAAILVCPAVFKIPMARLPGQGLGPAADADLGGVFAVADVAEVMQCPDLPVAADPGGELGGGGLVGGVGTYLGPDLPDLPVKGVNMAIRITGDTAPAR
jgi:hypothetical protein